MYISCKLYHNPFMPFEIIKVKQPKIHSTQKKYVQSLDDDELQAMEIIKQEFRDAFWIEQTNGFLDFLKKEKDQKSKK